MARDRSSLLDRLKASGSRLGGKFRYGVSEINEHKGDLHWWRQRVASRIAGPALGVIHGNEGIDYMERDWDNLLVLDACRADLFEEAFATNRFHEYERVHSPGCSSPEWMAETFDDRQYPDTIYVTANPWISKVAPDSFHDVVNLWVEEGDLSEDEIRGADGAIEDVGVSGGITIHPDTLSDAARRIHRENLDKRLIVHYFQPHAPVVGNPDGSRCEEIRDELHPGDDLREGNVTRAEVWEGYLDNLEYAFTHAEALADDLGGRTVFTADHGELFGEWLWPFPIRGYAHPNGVRHPRLTEVPWAVKEVGDRRDVVAGDIEHHDADEDVVDERLRDLGYTV